MEIVVVSLVFLLLSQWMWGSSSKLAQSSEPTPLIAAPEPQPSGEKVRLLLDEQPESLPVAPVAIEAIAPIPPLESPVMLEAASINVVALEAMNPDEAVNDIPSSGFIAELTELPQPATVPQNTSRLVSRRDEVWALLD